MVHKLMQAMGVPCVQSAGEGEKCCALLCKRGIADYACSRDNDTVLFGATKIIRHLELGWGHFRDRMHV